MLGDDSIEEVDQPALSSAFHSEKTRIIRLGAAIDKATAAGASRAEAISFGAGPLPGPRFIHVQFDKSVNYVVPWEACYSWDASASNALFWQRLTFKGRQNTASRMVQRGRGDPD